MSDLTTARRYAQALHAEAEAQGQIERVDADIRTIRETLEASRELARLFESPVIPREKKQNVVRALFDAHLAPLTMRFLKLLISNQREDLFPSVVQAYQALRDRQLGVVEATARVAFAPSEQDLKDLETAVTRMTGKRVRLRVQQDPGLIGGVVIRVGDTVYDGSVRHQLERMREQLEHGAPTTGSATNGAGG